MPVQALDISLVSPLSLADNAASVLLEQDEWDPSVGKLSKLGVFAYLQGLLFGEETADLQDCGTDALGWVRKDIYAYPSSPGLGYLIGISHGEIGERIVEDLEYAEVINLQNETEIGLKYPCQGIISKEWITDSFDSEGGELPRPKVSISSEGDDLQISGPAVGALLVVYRVIRHRYHIDVPPRENAGENSLQSFVWVVWSGGNNYMEVSLPDDQDMSECNNWGGGGGHIGSPGPNRPESVPPEDENRDIDYCTQLEI